MSLPIKKRRFAHGSIAQFFSGDATASNSQNEGFVEGSIVRITMHNFLTYDHAEVFPGPKLNMIVGANGTGKSSVVCAICLGLAGKTSVVGRGDKVGVYVKRGCTKGSVEIELFRESGNLIITREIQSEHNQSTWMLNRKPCSQKAVEEAVKELHIQVGNLCQFLPQEKVGEFAKMSKVELLEATEKSVGPPEMFQIHCKLKSFRTTEREIENGCKERASFLEKAKQSNERNKVDVERYYLKKKHLDKIQMLEQKLPWVEYEASREGLKGIKQEREEVKRNLRSLREAQEPLKKKISSVESQIQPIEKQIQEKTTRIREAMNECKKKSDQLETKNKEVDSITQGLILKQTEEADRKKRIDLTHLIIKDLQDELVKMGSLDDIMPEIETINAELRAIQEEKAKLDSASLDLRRDKDEATGERNRLQNQLRSLEDVMKIKEGHLRKRYGDTYTALLWLRQNHHRFEGKVHEPMMLVINVHDPRHAKYIESHIPINDLRAFVFEKKEDKELFMCEIRDTQKLRINTIIAPARSQSATAPMLPLESLKPYGIFSYLRELFDAPEEVMSYLCHQCRVHDVPVGTEKTKSLIERMAREVPLRVVYTAEERYSIKKSFYSGKTITSNSDVRASQFLSMTVNVEMRRQLQEQLQAAEQQRQNSDVQLQTLRERQAVLERRDNELRARKKQLSDQRSKKRQLEQKISAKQDSVRQMEQNVINLPAVEKKANAKIVAINKQKTVILEEHLSLIELKISTSMERVYLALESAGLMAEKTKLETDCKDNFAELTQAEQEFKRLEELKTTATATCRALLEKACKICKLPGSGGGSPPVLPAHLYRGFKELPNTLAEIEAMLNEEKARAECFTGLSAAVLEEYKQREKEILNMEKDLEDRMNKLTTYRQDISSAKERWLNPLKNLVEQINERFSDFFRSMHCAGEVDLHTENEEEYDKYGIRIRVKFRSSMELHELTPYHQSGGERSVSTMLYLMSLQKLNRCPFRVVDEINQGMDPVNERRVFDIVVKAACGGNTSQYFFITPKLLQNLQYDEQMTILFVHNGPHMLPSNQWKESAFLRRVKNRT